MPAIFHSEGEVRRYCVGLLHPLSFFCQMSIQTSLNGSMSARFMQTTSCIPHLTIGMIKKSISFFRWNILITFHVSLCTNDTTFSSRIMFSFEYSRFFCSSKKFHNSSSSRLIVHSQCYKKAALLTFHFPFLFHLKY